MQPARFWIRLRAERASKSTGTSQVATGFAPSWPSADAAAVRPTSAGSSSPPSERETVIQ